MSGFWNTLKISKCYTVICKCRSIFILHWFEQSLTKHWNIWCIAREGWVGCYCFLTKIFLITFKCLQNIRILCFHFAKFPLKNIICWKKMKMVECSFFITNFYYIFSNVKCQWNREIRHLLTKISIFVNSVTRSTCDARLIIMMKQ